MKNNIYPCFKWPGTIWFYSDPHFGDDEAYKYRGSIINDEEQIKRINSKVSKTDTLVILGDVGNINAVKRLHGYKVLILGNHDAGASKYQRIIKQINIPYSNSDFEFIKTLEKGDIRYSKDSSSDFLVIDNRLFDEVYSGCLMLNEKIILSHEPINIFDYALNIHGHDHSCSDYLKYVLRDYDTDIATIDMRDAYLDTIKTYNLMHLNVCAECIGYYPICLSRISKSGALKHIKSIHKETIDLATKNKIAKG